VTRLIEETAHGTALDRSRNFRCCSDLRVLGRALLVSPTMPTLCVKRDFCCWGFRRRLDNDFDSVDRPDCLFRSSSRRSSCAESASRQTGSWRDAAGGILEKGLPGADAGRAKHVKPFSCGGLTRSHNEMPKAI